jgi:hypothetical protein
MTAVWHALFLPRHLLPEKAAAVEAAAVREEAS